ncbi:MAG: peptide deformylase [Phycisphaerae bacterium]|nr:peptide deformylase [Phycisphaerae bacterium]
MAGELPTRIIKYPDPRLRKVSEPVTTFDQHLAALIDRLIELMRTGDGVGLAAPQAGVSRRIIVYNATGKKEDSQVLINPELLDLAGQVEAEEGCLSLPDIRVVIRRARQCRVRAQDIAGKPFELQGQDLLARIWQHENDHLDGKLIIDRMDATDRIANRKKIAELETDYARNAKYGSKGKRVIA